jgi:hypothetical protein
VSDRELSNWLDSFVQFTDNSEPPISFRLWTAISCIAAVLRRKCYLPWGSLTFFPNMYVVLVAPSGKARKGTAMGPGQKLLRDLDIKMTAEAITRESLIRELANANDSYIDHKERVIEHSSMTIFSKELTVFLGYQNHQLMSDLTDWFDCDDHWTYRTKTQGTDIVAGVWVNLIGATTPSLIQTAMSLEAIGGGLTSRMIFVYEHKRGKSVALPMLTPDDHILREKLLRDLERISMVQGEFSVDDTFIAPWVPWYEQQEENPPFNDNRFAGYFERRAMHCLKLAMILNVSRTDTQVITSKDFYQAKQILEKTEQKMPFAFSGVGKGANIDTMSQVMTEMAVVKETTFAELMNRFYYDVDKRTLTSILETLEAMGQITTGQSGNQRIVRWVKGG